MSFIARSRVLCAKADVPMAMSKWWKKIKPVEAEITQHLAANEQNILVPWIKTFPKKMVDRVPTYLWPLGTVTIVYVVVTITDAADHAEDYAHRF